MGGETYMSTIYTCRMGYCHELWNGLFQWIYTQLLLYTLRLVNPVCCKVSKVGSFLQHILRRYVDMFWSVTGLGSHYSQLHFKLNTQITLAPIHVLQQHFQCHSQYYSSLTVSVCKHTATFCTATSVLLLLGVLQCCDQHSVPGVPHHIPYRNGIRGTCQTCRGNVKIRKDIWRV